MNGQLAALSPGPCLQVKGGRRGVITCLRGSRASEAVLPDMYGGVSKKSFPSAFSEVRFPLFRPYLIAPPNRSPRQRHYTPSPVKELPKGTSSIRRLLPLYLGGKAPKQLTRVRVVEYTAWQKFLGMERTFWAHLREAIKAWASLGLQCLATMRDCPGFKSSSQRPHHYSIDGSETCCLPACPDRSYDPE
jgi:hypothetical protein